MIIIIIINKYSLQAARIIKPCLKCTGILVLGDYLRDPVLGAAKPIIKNQTFGFIFYAPYHYQALLEMHGYLSLGGLLA